MAQVLGEDFKTAVRKRNLERLRSLDVRTRDDIGILGGVGDGTTPEEWMAEVKTWIAASGPALGMAKSSRVIGEKNKLDWNNVVLTFLENAVISIRDLERVANAIVATKSGDDDTAMQELRSADAHITEMANIMGLDYVTTCDLPLVESPEDHWAILSSYCGMFWSADPSSPFIGIVFKGTNVYILGEVQVDLQRELQQMENDVLYNTHVSKGVSNALFSEYPPIQGAAFDYIRDTLLGNNPGLPNSYMVHVTGRSLGASYATLFYNEFLRQINSGDHHPGFLLGDLYAFGGPRVGGDDFAGMAKSAVDRHMGSSWRIVNEGDPIAVIPPAPGRHICIPKPDPPVFFHVDSGMMISPTEEPVCLESEVGRAGAPHSNMTWDEINMAAASKHTPRAYWASVVKVAGIPWMPAD